MRPGKSGFAVVQELRASKQFVPVLMLTARSRPEDVLQGFASGADDYLPKPFELPILIARLDGLLRRTNWMKDAAHAVSRPDLEDSTALEAGRPDVFGFGGKTIDFGELELRTFGNT